MDYEWIRVCLIVIAATIVVALSSSYVARVLLDQDKQAERFLNARRKTFKKCDEIAPAQWPQAIVAVSARSYAQMTPVSIFPFADYVDGRVTECQYPQAIDYGVAVGYSDTDSQCVDAMASYVFWTENLAAEEQLSNEERRQVLANMSRVSNYVANNASRFQVAEQRQAVISEEIHKMFAANTVG